jgi:hypothetical protein
MAIAWFIAFSLFWSIFDFSFMQYIASRSVQKAFIVNDDVLLSHTNLVPRAFPFLSLGRREKALAPGGLLCILIGQ